MIERGRFVLVRTYSAGVHCGFLEDRDPRGQWVCLREARRLWRWHGANTLNELALRGCAENSNISEPVPELELGEAIEILGCTEAAQANLTRSRWTT